MIIVRISLKMEWVIEEWIVWIKFIMIKGGIRIWRVKERKVNFFWISGKGFELCYCWILLFCYRIIIIVLLFSLNFRLVLLNFVLFNCLIGLSDIYLRCFLLFSLKRLNWYYFNKRYVSWLIDLRLLEYLKLIWGDWLILNIVFKISV